jgi:DNA-binding transcriptional MerR regulator
MQTAAAKIQKTSFPIPDKLFYKIGEISRITGVEPYVLRYWETEFPFLTPRKSRSGQRIYSKKDMEIIFEIKDLLYNERYTIEGVRKRLGDISASRKAVSVDTPLTSEAAIEHTKRRLKDIISQLKQ